MRSVAFIHGAFAIIALLAIVAERSMQSTGIAPWLAGIEHDEDVTVSPNEEASEKPVRVLIESACEDDYRRAPPPDGWWCGVRLDDRDPVRGDSFPYYVEIQVETLPDEDRVFGRGVDCWGPNGGVEIPPSAEAESRRRALDASVIGAIDCTNYKSPRRIRVR